MRKSIARLLVIGVLGLALGARAGEPAPAGKMVKVVFRNVSPGVQADSFEGGPRTLYRLGEGYGRMEYPQDSKGQHPLMVVASPDFWLVDLAGKTARHQTDSGPSQLFRAPVVPPETALPALRKLEFGREFEFLEARGATVAEVEAPSGGRLDRYEAPVGNLRVLVFTKPGERRVSALEILEARKVRLSYRYDEYRDDLEPDLTLFRLPPDVRVLDR